jgi:uncharacterized protein (TIGR01244 family)
MRMRIVSAALVAAVVVAAPAWAQVTKATVPGVMNFAKVETTIACAGATAPAGVGELKRLGYASIINLRQPTEAGADVDAEAAAAQAAGMRYVHLPLNGAAPDPAIVDQFLKAVVDPANQPVLVHCATGNRAAALWMIKRMVVDGWDADRASTEAAALGLTSPALRAFALDYAAAHKR